MYKIGMYVNKDLGLWITLWGLFTTVEAAEREIELRHARVSDLCFIYQAK